MAATLATCTKEEQRSVIRFFLRSEGVKRIEINRRMDVQYGDACLSLQQVYEWSRKFLSSVSYVTDPPRPFCFLDRAFSITKTKINQQNAQINSGLIYY